MTHEPTCITNMLEKIQLRLEHLSKSERKVADIIPASPGQATHSSTAALTVEASVNEPTVNRFYRDMDARGFLGFELHLVQSLASGTPYANRNVDEDDSAESYTEKIFESATTGLDYVRQSLDSAAVSRAVDLLTRAKKIAFFGLGSSTTVAHDAMNKSFRFSVPIIYSDDTALRRMSCVSCSNGDVIVLISHTGRTRSLVELTQLTRGNDTMVIVLTSPDTPLAREATLTITLDVSEDADIYMPTVFRLARLTVIDVLATRLTLRRRAKFKDNLKHVGKALRKSRFDKELPIKNDDR